MGHRGLLCPSWVQSRPLPLCPGLSHAVLESILSLHAKVQLGCPLALEWQIISRIDYLMMQLKEANMKKFRVGLLGCCFFSENNWQQMTDKSRRRCRFISCQRSNLLEGETNAWGHTAFQELGLVPSVLAQGYRHSLGFAVLNSVHKRSPLRGYMLSMGGCLLWYVPDCHLSSLRKALRMMCIHHWIFLFLFSAWPLPFF